MFSLEWFSSRYGGPDHTSRVSQLSEDDDATGDETDLIDPRDYYTDVGVFLALSRSVDNTLRNMHRTGTSHGDVSLTEADIKSYHDFYRNALYVVGHGSERQPIHSTSVDLSASTVSTLISAVGFEDEDLLYWLIDYGRCLTEAARNESLSPCPPDTGSTAQTRFSDCTPTSISRDHPLWKHAVQAFDHSPRLKYLLAKRAADTKRMVATLSEGGGAGDKVSRRISYMPEGQDKTVASTALESIRALAEDPLKGLSEDATVRDQWVMAYDRIGELNELVTTLNDVIERQDSSLRPTWAGY